jgi:hypothetical protein
LYVFGSRKMRKRFAPRVLVEGDGQRLAVRGERDSRKAGVHAAGQGTLYLKGL